MGSYGCPPVLCLCYGIISAKNKLEKKPEGMTGEDVKRIVHEISGHIDHKKVDHFRMTDLKVMLTTV